MASSSAGKAIRKYIHFWKYSPPSRTNSSHWNSSDTSGLWYLSLADLVWLWAIGGAGQSPVNLFPASGEGFSLSELTQKSFGKRVLLFSLSMEFDGGSLALGFLGTTHP